MLPSNNDRLIATILLLAEAAAAAYVTFVVFLLSVWMVDDFVAFQMSSKDCAASVSGIAARDAYPGDSWGLYRAERCNRLDSIRNRETVHVKLMAG
jgi:hypothetical protein